MASWRIASDQRRLDSMTTWSSPWTWQHSSAACAESQQAGEPSKPETCLHIAVSVERRPGAGGRVESGYFGSKATSGLCQPITALMPPTTLTSRATSEQASMKRALPALRNVGSN